MPEIPQMADYFRYSPYIHPSVMFRRELFDQERGYLDTQETLRCEDYEIFMSLVGRGQKGYNLQESLFRYRETRESYRKRKIHYRINEAKPDTAAIKSLGFYFRQGGFMRCAL